MSVIFLKYEFASQIALILSKTIGYYVFYGIYHQIIPNVNIVNIVNIVNLADFSFGVILLISCKDRLISRYGRTRAACYKEICIDSSKMPLRGNDPPCPALISDGTPVVGSLGRIVRSLPVGVAWSYFCKSYRNVLNLDLLELSSKCPISLN